jgi:hypothetical protein
VSKRGLLFLALAAIMACGDSVSPPMPLALATSYDVTGVYRVLRDGVEPIDSQPFYLLLEELAVNGTSVTGFVRRKGAEDRFALTGSYDVNTGDFIFEPSEATLSSTVTEFVQELGARGADARPTDSIADEAPGFFRSLIGSTVRDGGFLAISRIDNRPGRPDETKIRAELSGVGRVTLRGEAGSVPPNLGVELYRFRLNQRNPVQTIELAAADGSFQAMIDGLEGELFLVRTVRAGVVSEARAVRVTRP